MTSFLLLVKFQNFWFLDYSFLLLVCLEDNSQDRAFRNYNIYYTAIRPLFILIYTK